MKFLITVANNSHFKHATAICKMMTDAAKVRGTGIAKRQPEYICKKMKEGKAVIALDGEIPIGFCYIESWEGQKYVANSNLIIFDVNAVQIPSISINFPIIDAFNESRFSTGKLFGGIRKI